MKSLSGSQRRLHLVRLLLAVVVFIFFTYLCITMKFYDKYPKLKEKGFLTKVLTDTVFSTMSLEDQQVAKSKVNEMVMRLLSEQESKGNQFFAN